MVHYEQGWGQLQTSITIIIMTSYMTCEKNQLQLKLQLFVYKKVNYNYNSKYFHQLLL